MSAALADHGPCRDYDPMFKLHGCELDAGHGGPHRDLTGSEWDEHLPHEPGRCDSHAPWGSGWRDQRCTLDSGHRGPHSGRSGNDWANPADDRAALIDGLVALACFLEAHPEAPVPHVYADGDNVVMHVFPDGDTDDERRAVVDSAAEALNATPGESRPGSGHYQFSLRFGPVTYCMVTISREQTAKTAQDLDDEPVAA